MNVISISSSVHKYEAFYSYTLALLQSIRENAEMKLPVILWVDGYNEEQLNNFKRVYPDIEFREIDREKYIKYGKGSAGWYCMEAFTIREYDKVLNLDCDMICRGSLKELFDIDCKLGMVKESTGIYNGGLTLIGKEFLNNDIYNTLMSSVHKEISIGNNRDKWSKDQKLYNYFFEKEITELEHKYNWLVGEAGSAGATIIHYIYKPLYDLGKQRLNDINPELYKIWNSYYYRAKL